jgi:hypothetical protein
MILQTNYVFKIKTYKKLFLARRTIIHNCWQLIIVDTRKSVVTMMQSREWMFLLLCVLLNMAVQATSAQNRNSNLFQSKDDRRRRQQNTSNRQISQQGKLSRILSCEMGLLVKISCIRLLVYSTFDQYSIHSVKQDTNYINRAKGWYYCKKRRRR